MTSAAGPSSADADADADAHAADSPWHMADLPAGVRRELLSAASSCLDELAAPDVPPPLRRVRAFAPARRATAAAGPLGTALEGDPAFRQQVGAHWRASHPLAGDLVAGAVDDVDVPAEQLVAGYLLLRPSGWRSAAAVALERVRRQEEERERERVRAGRDAQVQRLSEEVDGLRAQVRHAQREAEQARAERDALAKELRRHRADADRARSAARVAGEDRDAALAARDEALALLAQAVRERDEARSRAHARAEDRRRRLALQADLGEVRARLLLDTLVEAATGLRRELALPPASAQPADLAVELGIGAGAPARAPGHALPVDDVAMLEQWLALPRAHLIVDGYNVTKTAHPARTLAEQRRWLVEALAGLAARTGAETTCCFDGAAVVAEPGVLTRGVRVLFSEAGVEADLLVARLVEAEPPGRPVVVVSSDAAVARAVTSAGARCATSAALIRHLGRSGGAPSR